MELSRLLNRMAHVLGVETALDFRNPNSVYMKMMNFRRFDPTYTGQGRVGLTRGNKDEEVVWNEFRADKSRLQSVASAIRAAVDHDSEELSHFPADEEGIEAPEGRVLTRLHRVRERNRKLVEDRKARALKLNGKLVCEVCEFDFGKRYGERGNGFIEAHHTQPLATLAENSKTKLADLALVCANCHRMIHALKPWFSIEELRAVLR
jgi:5-methylcytosine-specific restriction protein A